MAAALPPVLWFPDVRSGGRPGQSPRLRVHGIGYRDAMRPCLVDRLRGTDDHLFMYFHTPVVAHLGGEPCELPAHRFVLWKPGQRHAFGNAAARWEHSWLHCAGRAVSEALAGAGLPTDRAVALPDDRLVDTWLGALHHELARQARPDGVILESLLAVWVRELVRAAAPGDAAGPPARLAEVVRALERDLARPWRLRDLAALAGLSVSRFSAEFQRHFACSAMDYLQRARLRHALHLLRDRNLAIREVAAQVGFPDPFYFSRRFRRAHGESPQQFRGRFDG